MEFGNDTTLFSPISKDELTEIAEEKELNKPYWGDENWKPDDSLSLMSDEELRIFGEEKRKDIKRLFDFGKKTSSEGLSQVKLEQPTNETATAREAAISYGGVKIMALSGQETILSEYLGDDMNRKVWQFEPHPDFEKEVAKRGKENDWHVTKSGLLEKADEGRLWQFLETTVEEIKNEKGISLDINNLTPYQAVLVIETLIRKRFNYEYLLANGNATTLVEKVKEHGKKTSREDLLELAEREPKKFEKSVADLEEKIDRMSANQLLEFQFGVCRHIAGTSQKLFEVLRKKQDGLLLNGSYMVYHSEGLGNQDNSRLIEDHAYNILAVTTPGEDNNTEVSLSVLDPTWRLNSERLDYTYRRISQAISFLVEYGEKLGVEDKDAVCRHLAAMAGERLHDWIISKRNIRVIDDYAALLVLAGKSSDEIIYKLKEINTEFGNSQPDFILDMFNIPTISYDIGEGDRAIRDKFGSLVAKEITQYQFNADPEMKGTSEELRTVLDRIVSKTNPDWWYLSKWSYFDAKKHKFTDEERGTLAMVNELVRASVELDKDPSKIAQGVIKKMAALERRVRMGIINLNLVERMIAMIMKHEAK